MSSNVQSGLEFLQLNDYISVVIVTAILYDYFLTFSREIDYVWCKPWSWVSIMYILVRYVGLLGSTFVPGPITMYVHQFTAIHTIRLRHGYSKGTVLYLVIYWAFPIFLLSADLVMILRVYAMWNRSKWILSILLFVCVPQVVISFVLAGIYYNPNTYFSVTIIQVGGFSFCNGLSEIPSPLLLGVTIPRFVLGVTLLTLAAIPTLKGSIEMYRATRIWQLNQYVQQLMRDGIFYFFVVALYNVHDIITSGPAIDATPVLILTAFSYIAICPIMPRFIISVRELYEHDLRGRWQGIDTGFGMLSEPAHEDATVTVVAFSDGDADESEAIRLELLVDNTCRV
ncbi:hypothetical protein HD554DRAFT_1769883 [Boletus coccyginus]|nr:hypothetical protein HD554DRAFT_1769883 [Boletus coccyginus]